MIFLGRDCREIYAIQHFSLLNTIFPPQFFISVAMCFEFRTSYKIEPSKFCLNDSFEHFTFLTIMLQFSVLLFNIDLGFKFFFTCLLKLIISNKILHSSKNYQKTPGPLVNLCLLFHVHVSDVIKNILLSIFSALCTRIAVFIVCRVHKHHKAIARRYQDNFLT